MTAPRKQHRARKSDFLEIRKMLTDEIERVAQAIYATHWRSPSQTWEEASEAVKDWVRAQALSAINQMRARGWRKP
jgi:hypothetical protein